MPFDETQGKPEDKRSTRSEREEKVLQFWKDNKIFQKSLEKESPKGDFVFYEGPPTANGRPAIHHLEARAFKDVIPRYKTMQGFRVPRQAGWDTHGLPVEIETEKALGLKSKKEIEEYGVEKFNAECKKSVGRYINDWKEFTDRMGYWVNFDEAYFTYNNSYIESVWSVIGHVEKRKLLYKDYKIVPWCPRCGTTLSSHEIAQGYKDVKDLSLYVKFRITNYELGIKNDINTFLLAWTTTPWTLPGNVALAVGSDIEYVEVRSKKQEVEESLILAKSRMQILGDDYEIVREMKGRDLVGLEYEPLYPFIPKVSPLESNPQGDTFGRAFRVYPADFVTTVDGTGIVHTAVMYGQEDFDLGTKVGLPKVHLVSPDGTFMKSTGWLEGRSVVDESLAVDILKDLQKRGLLFDKENYTHSYPFCWRCGTRLIYYARDSWYIRMSKLREKLIEENQKINWEPDYIKEGRFGEWLREVKDWAISRERYWGTPLPIWMNEDGERIVVDSIDTLRKFSNKSGNRYFIMRHGGSEMNERNIVSFKYQADDHLTEKGRNQVLSSMELLKNNKIDLIISSPFTRTKETAEIVREKLDLSTEIILDSRIQEISPGEFDGKDWNEYHRTMYEQGPGWFDRSMPDGEALADVNKRIGEFIYETESKYKDKNILIITHGGPAWVFFVNAGLFSPENKKYEIAGKSIFIEEFKRFENAEVRELPFVPLPHDKNYNIDLHKPFIDQIILEKDGKEFRRVSEVMDVWFDSGAMPFAQSAGSQTKNLAYPADFISEGIDQTRGWFYTMHAIGILMERGLAYKNVICLGLIMDQEGKKMSKSIGNVVDPWDQMQKYGADALRLWMYSVNQPGESKNFDEQTVEEINRKVFNLLDNVYAFYDLYAEKGRTLSTDAQGSTLGSENILDQWILTRFSELTNLVTSQLDAYRLLEPVRATREFIDDLSTWYLRRSRDRIKEGDEGAKQTLYFVLKNISKILAPFAPFYAEDLYQKLRTETDPESVHLEAWPDTKGRTLSIDSQGSTLEKMQEVRKIVTLALEARSKANIKVRQPLSELRIKNYELGVEYLNLIQDELNVKKVVQDKNLDTEIKLDINITLELAEEGKVREIIRSIQEMRKEKSLKPQDEMSYEVKENKELFEKYKLEIEKTTNTKLLFTVY